MTALFVAAFVIGLILGVVAMFFGVERRRHHEHQDHRPDAATTLPGVEAPGEISARLNVPVIAAFATLFGASGYLLQRFSTLSTPVVTVLALLVGGIGIVLAVLVVAKWAVPSARREVVDERYVLQGHLARVLRPIQENAPGEVTFEVDGVHHTMRALTVDGSAVGAEHDVVIDRIEDGVAYVEAWTVVEKRI